MIMMNKYSAILMMALATIACSSPESAAPNGSSQVLADGWTLTRAGASAKYEAEVPSTVAGALSEAGFFAEDLMVGRNYEKVDKTIFDDTWTYTRLFSGKPAKGQRVELVFDGLDYYADIFLNGKQLASADTTFGVFIRRAYDVTDLLKNRNKLEVKLRRAQKGDLNIGFVDWNPRPLDESMGIVRPVTLHTTGAISIEDVYVVPDLDVENFKTADLSVRVTLRNRENRSVEANLVLSLGDRLVRLPVALAACETKEVGLTPAEAALLHIDNPRVWWTWDLGTPELYTLSVCVEDGDTVSDTR